MNEDITLEFLEVSNIKTEYVYDVIRQYTDDGWHVVKQTSELGQDGLERADGL